MLSILFNRIIEMSLAGSIIVILIMMIKLVFKDKFSPKWHYFIWFVLLIKLLMPVDIESSLGVMPKIDFQKHVGESVSMTIDSDIQQQEWLIQDLDDKEQSVTIPRVFQSTRNPVKFITILERLWIVITLTLILIKISLEWLFFKKQKRIQKLCNPMINDLLSELKDDIGIKRKIDVYIEKSNTVPKVYGLLKPRIIISEHVLYTSDRSRIKHILLHELSHIKQKDIAVSVIRNLLLCLYFFNPVIVWGLKRMASDCESACDARVLKILTPKEHKAYGYTLISLISKLDKSRNALALSLGHKKDVIRRLKMISAYRKTTFSGKVMSLLLAVLIIVSCLFVPSATAENYETVSSHTIKIVEDKTPINSTSTVDILDVSETEIIETEFIFPVESKIITSSYGIKVHAITKEEKLHTGIDIGAPKGADIIASEDGTVVYVDDYISGGYGKFLIIEHENGFKTLYAHCKSIVVESGDVVKQGQKIATVGNTGQSTGPHLHFEVHENDEPIDPMSVLSDSDQ